MHRSRLLMIGGLALAVGLLVSYTVYNRLRLFPGQGSERGVQLLVAADDIQLATKLEAKDVRIVTVPLSAAPPNAFTTPAEVLKRVAILPISKGEFLLPNKLASLGVPAGIQGVIPLGMRAVSVRVNDVVSVAGFVQPGTRVDVLATGTRGGGNDRQTTTVLENVAVIAVGKNLDRNSDTQAAAPVITLLVSPDDAQKLALVSQEGRIQLSLRNPLDTKKGGIGATRTSSLYAGDTPPPSEAKPRAKRTIAKATLPANAPYAVEMIRGSKRDETKF